MEGRSVGLVPNICKTTISPVLQGLPFFEISLPHISYVFSEMLLQRQAFIIFLHTDLVERPDLNPSESQNLARRIRIIIMMSRNVRAMRIPEVQKIRGPRSLPIKIKNGAKNCMIKACSYSLERRKKRKKFMGVGKIISGPMF